MKMWKPPTSPTLAFVSGLLLVSPGYALTLQEYLNTVSTQNHFLKSLDESLVMSEQKQQAGDLELSPIVFGQAGFVKDDKLPLMPLLGTKTETTSYTLGLSKKFSSGTSAKIQSNIYKLEYYDSTPAGRSAAAAFGLNNDQPVSGSVALSLTQSLWKDGFGRGTTLRHRREEMVRNLETAGALAQRQQYLAQAETAYWDLWYLQEEVRVRKSSIDRAKRFESWTSKRLGNGIGDRADMLQAKSLVTQRDLQLSLSEDDLIAAQKKLLDFMETANSSVATVTVTEGDWKSSRDLKSMVASAGGSEIMSFDSHVAYLQTRIKKNSVEEVTESVKPDLSLEAGYTTNGMGEDYSSGLSNSTRTDQSTTSIAIKFSMPLGDAKTALQNSSRSDYNVTQTQAERKFLESQTQWNEMNRRHGEMQKKIQIAESLATLQTEKLAREQQRLGQGRTTTAQVITFEQDSAEAQLTALKLKAELRKLEAQARMFVASTKDVL
jgi:outer membrane protein TolC